VPQWVELANGCLCCSVKAEFVQALEALLDAGSGHAGKFDYVLVETTGARGARGVWCAARGARAGVAGGLRASSGCQVARPPLRRACTRHTSLPPHTWRTQWNTHRTHAPPVAGLANPGPIISELWTDEELEAAVTLDGVITLVDARNVTRQLRERRRGGAPNEAQMQVALADVILLNKVLGRVVACGVWRVACGV
jgi:hypothetical protein